MLETSLCFLTQAASFAATTVALLMSVALHGPFDLLTVVAASLESTHSVSTRCAGAPL